MWSMLRKDFTELVTTVREDTSSILSTIARADNDYDDNYEDDFNERQNSQQQPQQDEVDQRTGRDEDEKKSEVTNKDKQLPLSNPEESLENNKISQSRQCQQTEASFTNHQETEDGNEQTPLVATSSSNSNETEELQQQFRRPLVPRPPEPPSTLLHNLKWTEAEREAYHRMTQVETYITPLVPPVIESSDEALKPVEGERDEVVDGSSTLKGENNGSDSDVGEFIRNFIIDDAKQQEISQLVMDCPELKELFEELVPEHVSYVDFWQRYCYRCDIDRIQRELDFEQERIRQGRAKALSKVSNFFGGAVDAVASALIVTATSAKPKGGGNAVNGSPTDNQGPKGLVFVKRMMFETDDEDEELGWGDDDEDDDDGALKSTEAAAVDDSNHPKSITTPKNSETDVQQDDESNEEQPSTDELIVFNDVALDQAREELKLALELRDQLHQTVELQKQEIIQLQLQLQEQKRTSLDSSVIDTNDEIGQLKLKLFEKESELEAMKQNMLDDKYDDDMHTNSKQKQCEGDSSTMHSTAATLQLQEQKELIQSLQTRNDALIFEVNSKNVEMDEMMTAMQQRKAELDAVIDALQSELKFVNGNLEASKMDSSCYIQELRDHVAQQTVELSNYQKEIALLREKVQLAESALLSNQEEIQSLNNTIQTKDSIIAKLNDEILSTKLLLQQQQLQNKVGQQQTQSVSSSSTPETTSSSELVHVSSAPSKITHSVVAPTTQATTSVPKSATLSLSATKLSDDEDSSDWGDEWD